MEFYLHNVIYKGRDEFLFFKYYKDVSTDDMGLYIYKNNEYLKIDTTFEKIDKYFYRCKVNFDFIGRFYFRVTLIDERIGGGVINIKEDLLSELYNYEVGNWKIENKVMKFYDLQGNLIKEYDLLDDNGSPTDVNVFERRAK